MNDDAIEARTQLKLKSETEEKVEQLADLKFGTKKIKKKKNNNKKINKKSIKKIKK